NRILVHIQADIRDRLLHDPSPMHEAPCRTIRHNPRYLHTVRRVAPISGEHLVYLEESSRPATNFRLDTENELSSLADPQSHCLWRSTPRPMMPRVAVITDGLGQYRETCHTATQARNQRRCRKAMHAEHANGPVRMANRASRV